MFFRAPSVLPEHLLLALLAVPEAVGHRLLRRQGVHPERVLRDLVTQLDRCASPPAPPPPPPPALAPETEAVLIAAHEEAKAAMAEYVGTEFLLLALLGQVDRPAGQVLVRHGLAAPEIRTAIVALPNQPPA